MTVEQVAHTRLPKRFSTSRFNAVEKHFEFSTGLWISSHNCGKKLCVDSVKIRCHSDTLRSKMAVAEYLYET